MPGQSGDAFRCGKQAPLSEGFVLANAVVESPPKLAARTLKAMGARLDSPGPYWTR